MVGMITKVLLWIWQFPQMIAGRVMILILKAEKRETEGYIWYQFKNDFLSGVSLGSTTLLKRECLTTIKHEYGHYTWSKYLGILYLVVIGIPSVIANLKSKRLNGWTTYDKMYWYYKLNWTERIADKSGGVDRDIELRKRWDPHAVHRYPQV